MRAATCALAVLVKMSASHVTGTHLPRKCLSPSFLRDTLAILKGEQYPCAAESSFLSPLLQWTLETFPGCRKRRRDRWFSILLLPEPGSTCHTLPERGISPYNCWIYCVVICVVSSSCLCLGGLVRGYNHTWALKLSVIFLMHQFCQGTHAARPWSAPDVCSGLGLTLFGNCGKLVGPADKALPAWGIWILAGHAAIYMNWLPTCCVYLDWEIFGNVNLS